MRRLTRSLAVAVALLAPGLVAAPARAQAAVTVTVSTSGTPVEGAFVALTGSAGAYAAITGSSGEATFSSVADGSYTAVASAPGTVVGSGSVTVSGEAASATISIADSGNIFRGLGAYGAQTAGISADGAPGVFYLTTTAIPSFYRTADFGGTWAPVTISTDDADDSWVVVNNAGEEGDMSFGAERPGDIELPPPPPPAASARVRAATVASGEMLLGSGGGAFAAEIPDVDTTPPSSPVVGAMSAFQTSRTFAVSWSASSDAESGVADYVVDRRVRRFSTTAYTTTLAYRTQSTRSFTYTGSTGYELCFRATARNGAGLSSIPSGWRCTVVPANDTDLARSSGWARKASAGSYLNTVSVATARGATLSTPVAAARVISLIATRCPGCGTVDVYVGTRLVKRVSLASSTTRKRQFIPITTSGSRSGKLSIRVYTSGKPVRIEGLAVSK